MRDIERYAMLLKADPKFRGTFAEIVDLTAVERIDLQADDDFMKLADHVDPFTPDARRAFVARSAMQQHAARMHKILRSKQNIEIFLRLLPRNVGLRRSLSPKIYCDDRSLGRSKGFCKYLRASSSALKVLSLVCKACLYWPMARSRWPVISKIFPS